MQFVVSKQNLQKELGFVQGVVEKKNTIPVLSNILIESVGENSIRITGTDLDVTIQPGEAVLLSGGAANHDERIFNEPDRFAIERHPNPHLTFGYGPRFCIGASLARLELQAVFARLVPRFPTLRLAVPLEQLQTRQDILTGGLFELPVIWCLLSVSRVECSG